MRHRTNLDRASIRACSREINLRRTQYDLVRLRRLSRMGASLVTRLGENTAGCDVLSASDGYGRPRSRYARGQSRVGLLDARYSREVVER